MLEPSKNRASDDKATGGKRTGLEKKLFIGIGVVAVIALLFLILYVTKKTCSVSEEECTTKYCVKASAELMDFVDLKNDPCDNFYNYVCGHYIKDAVKKGAPTPILEINEQFKKEMKSYIVDPVKTKDTKANVAMKQFYQACMNESKMDADKDQTFKKAIDELGGWPMITPSWNGNGFDWLDWHIKSHRTGVPVIGFFSFRPAAVDENNTVLRVSASKLANVDVTRSDFLTVMKEIATYFGAPEGFGSENIEVSIFVETLKKAARDAELIEEEDVDEKTSTVANLYNDCPQIPWLKFLNGLSQGIREFKNDTEIVFGSLKEYCNALDDLLKKTPRRIIADYFVWSIIRDTHIFMSSGVREAYEKLDNKVQERYEVCFDLTDERFKYLKETIYIRKRTNPQVREQLKEMIGIMKEVFIEHIKVSTWMDEETKKRGIEKTNRIQDLIGADDSLYDVEKFDKALGFNGLEFSSNNPYQILMEKNIKENAHIWEQVYSGPTDDLTSFFSNVNDVNAFFAVQLNIMIVPAPILSSIFFNYKMPAFMNYGSIGRVIGHEIMHGFGEIGRHIFLNEGDEEMVDWWTNTTAESFNKTKQCAIKEYESMPFRYRLNGTLTLEENLSDIVGIDVAYEAYERWVKKHEEEKRLPGIPLSPKQIFWIQTGTFLCFRKLDDEAVDLEAEDEHAVPKFRVMAGARNSRYFAKDFNCPVGSLMNPKEKCRIL